MSSTQSVIIWTSGACALSILMYRNKMATRRDSEVYMSELLGHWVYLNFPFVVCMMPIFLHPGYGVIFACLWALSCNCIDPSVSWIQSPEVSKFKCLNS